VASEVEVHPVAELAALAAKAKSPQRALFEGTADRVGYWLTPPEIMAPLTAEFQFDYDACPFPRPAGFDGLAVEWGERTWVNPPFEGAGVGFTKWVNKAIEENRKGKTVVLILPMFAWLSKLVEAGAEVRSLGSHEWVHPNGKRRRAPKPSLLFILHGERGKHCATCQCNKLEATDAH